MGEVEQYVNLSDQQKTQYVDIFIEGFGHLFNFKKDLDRFQTLLRSAFHPLNSYAYIIDNEVLGIMLLATNVLRPFKFDESKAAQLFGKTKGVIMCKQINAAFQNKVVDNETDLYIDMLSVSSKARKQGIASKLFQFAFDLKEYNTYYLEVLSKNHNAKRLYEKLGFKEYKRKYFSLIRLMGYGYPILMKKS